MATVHPLPSPIHVWIHEKQSFEEMIKEKINDMHYKTCRLCEYHRIIIIICIICICVGSIVISVVLKSNNSSINPCYYYDDNTRASDVSETCVMYLWNIGQCSTTLQSNPTWRWWIQSPQGLIMVKCNAVYKDTLCGAGSYNTIRNYISLCNSRFGQ